MLNDSIQLLDGASIDNLVVASGTAFPGSVQAGEMFFRTDTSSMYIWTGVSWQIVGAGSPPSAGTEGSVQINASNVFGGGADLIFNTASNTLTIGVTGETGIVSGLPSTSATKGGNITISGGGNSNAGQGGDVNIVGGNAAASNGGSIILAAGHREDNAAGQGEIILKTWASGSLTERLRILSNGAWSVGTNGASYGTSGQVLTSNGNAAPTWQTGGSALTATQIGYGSGGNTLTGSSSFTWNETSKQLVVGSSAGNAIISGRTGQSAGHHLALQSGTTSSGAGGYLYIASGNGNTGGAGGTLYLKAGDCTSATSGNIDIEAGGGTGTTDGYIVIRTGQTPTERLRILNNGAWSIGTGGAAYGTSGQVLTSNGNAAPTWQAIPAASPPSTVAAGATDGTYQLGWKILPQNSQSANYTLVLADSGKHILHPSADTTARTITIPANSSVAYPVGTAVTIINQNGAGALTIAITSDTMRLAGAGTTGNRTLAANGVATAIKITSTEWIISGTNLT